MPYRTKYQLYHTDNCPKQTENWIYLEDLPEIPNIESKKQCGCWSTKQSSVE